MWPVPPLRLGTLEAGPASARPDLLAAPTLAALRAGGWLDAAGVVEIDPGRSDTAATRDAYGVPEDALANCVIVAGRREGVERLAACVVLAATRADVNGVVRRRLDVRKASFLPTGRAVELTGMAVGAITPVGLPPGWPVLLDRRVADADLVIVGSGIRASKLLVAGSLLAALPAAEVVDGLGL
ncbi:hypothetical protein GHK86_15865 [Acidimicrobiaceae bacterium USS-CC1]|uniref:YbaK/aminoacyl-tRNA synthetase-associated domain-containing protein n=1 Tax=Acidiferrimicrobium australe TaxID=2664430 RepID=A0ABW9QXC9_9ACTN|nr:hypothetical protein [Acidiferrimicrobium australe]